MIISALRQLSASREIDQEKLIGNQFRLQSSRNGVMILNISKNNNQTYVYRCTYRCMYRVLYTICNLYWIKEYLNSMIGIVLMNCYLRENCRYACHQPCENIPRHGPCENIPRHGPRENIPRHGQCESRTIREYAVLTHQ